MFWNMITIENTKNFKRALLWIELGLLTLLILILHIVLYVTIQTNLGGNVMPAEARAQLIQAITWPASLVNALNYTSGNSLGGLLLIILVGAVTAQEYTWRTMHLWLSHGIHRTVLLGAKFIALLLPAMLIVLTALVISGIVSAYISLEINQSLHLDQLDFDQLILSTLRTAFTLLPYAGLAFLFAIISRSTVVAVGGGLAYALLIEGVLTQILALVSGGVDKIGQYLPAGLAAGLLNLNKASMDITFGLNAGLQPETLDPTASAIGIILWTILFFGLALWSFQRQDLTE